MGMLVAATELAPAAARSAPIVLGVRRSALGGAGGQHPDGFIVVQHADGAALMQVFGGAGDLGGLVVRVEAAVSLEWKKQMPGEITRRQG